MKITKALLNKVNKFEPSDKHEVLTIIGGVRLVEGDRIIDRFGGESVFRKPVILDTNNNEITLTCGSDIVLIRRVGDDQDMFIINRFGKIIYYTLASDKYMVLYRVF